MQKEKNGKFRGAFSGYNKTDVNGYIAEMALEFARLRDEWETEKEKLIREREDIQVEKDICEKLRDELACQYYEAFSELRCVKECLETEREQAEQTQRELDELKKECADLRTALESAKTETEEANAKLAELSQSKQEENAVYEKLNETVDQIMETANSSAKEIVASALSRGDEIVAEAEKRAARIREDAVICSETAYYDEVMRFASEIRDSMNKLLQEIREKKAEVGNKLAEMRAGVDDKKTPDVLRDKKPASSIDEKIERFFKNTLDAISNMSGRKK